MTKKPTLLNRAIMFSRISTLLVILSLASLPVTGCRYFVNRTADFGDIFQFGLGATAEKSKLGPIPPAIGVHVQATDFINIGAIHFNGYVAEIDGRGLFAGHESRSRLGYGPFQLLKEKQDYRFGCENYFKLPHTAWANRMQSHKMRWCNIPAKQLNWEMWDDTIRYGTPLCPRGWQYWENFGVEAAICEPFLTHLGVTVRAGVDPSEIMDFVLGIFCIDFKRDDMKASEFRQAMACPPPPMLCPPPPACKEKMGKSQKEIKAEKAKKQIQKQKLDKEKARKAEVRKEKMMKARTEKEKARSARKAEQQPTSGVDLPKVP